MKCKNCGTDNDSDVNFCKNCGFKLLTSEVENVKEKSKIGKYIAIGLVIITILSTLVIISEISEQVPVYGTAYTVKLSDTGLSTSSWTIHDVSSTQKEYTGKDLWGQSEYTVTVWYFVDKHSGRMTYKTYHGVNSIKVLDSYRCVVGSQSILNKMIS